MITIFK